MDINVRKHNAVHVVQLRGDLKVGAGVDTLRQTFTELMNDGGVQLVVNLAEVPMVDSSGIGVLVRTLTQSKQHGGNVKLVNPSKFALQTLKIVGLLSLFEIFDEDNAAVASFG